MGEQLKQEMRDVLFHDPSAPSLLSSRQTYEQQICTYKLKYENFKNIALLKNHRDLNEGLSIKDS